jgi:hypothetical protein
VEQLAGRGRARLSRGKEPRAQVSSSGLKERIARGEDVSAFCPPAVAVKLRERLQPSFRSPS